MSRVRGVGLRALSLGLAKSLGFEVQGILPDARLRATKVSGVSEA